MSEQPRFPELPPAAALPDIAGQLENLVQQIDALVHQFDRLYEQRHFELQQKYGTQAFFDYKQTKRREPPLDTHRPDESPPTRDPSQSNHERDDHQK